MSEPLLVYFSSKSQNTHRFVGKLEVPSVQIPISAQEIPLEMNREFVLVCPTYAGDKGQDAVPKQVIRFLNNKKNRSMMRGVIASGNRNFGKYFAHAGAVISKKCGVPLLYKFELMGTKEDVQNVRSGLMKFWKSQSENKSLVTER